MINQTYKKDSDADKKISDTSDLVKKKVLNAKITEIEGKIPSLKGLATNSVLAAVEHKIPDVRALVEKTDYDTKICEIENKICDHNHDKYVTAAEFNILVTRVFNTRLAQTHLVKETNFDAKLQSHNKKTNSNKTKDLLCFTK